MIPLSLYIHTPWCVRKCPYCDFNSHALSGELPEDQYCRQLLADLDQDLLTHVPREIKTIFIGGGTPSLLSGHFYSALFAGIRDRLPWSTNIEITLEANPGAIEYDHFEHYRSAGINRLSFGVQSFSAAQLKTLGRIHSATDPVNAINAAKRAGFTNFNIDIMHGLPAQTVTEGLADLNEALALNPTHLSWYELTLEPNTLFYNQRPTLPAEDDIMALQKAGKELLRANGYHQYEISAYAKNNYQCRHNVNYWQFGDYLGIGAGAHSKITDLQTGKIKRSVKLKNPKQYLDAENDFCVEEKIVEKTALPFEFMLNALRLSETMPLSLFNARTGLNADILMPGLTAAKQQGFLTLENNCIHLTEQGRCFYNDVVALFL